MPPRRNAPKKAAVIPFQQMVICMAGRFSVTQRVLQEKAEEFGAQVVKKSTDAGVTHLLCNDAASAAAAQAVAAGIVVLDESAFEALYLAEQAAQQAAASAAKSNATAKRTASKTAAPAKTAVAQMARPAGVVDPASNLSGRGVAVASDAAHGVPLDFMLAYVDLKSDKYYVGQVIKVKATQYVFFTRWGRTGTKGQTMSTPCRTLGEAQAEFEKKFEEKTGREWASVCDGSFKPMKGKYDLLHTSTIGAVAQAKASGVMWRYYVNDGVNGKADGWYDYDADNSDVVEDLYQAWLLNPQQQQALSKRLVTSESSGFTYAVDLVAMEQTNTSTGKVRKIIRHVPGVTFPPPTPVTGQGQSTPTVQKTTVPKTTKKGVATTTAPSTATKTAATKTVATKTVAKGKKATTGKRGRSVVATQPTRRVSQLAAALKAAPAPKKKKAAPAAKKAKAAVVAAPVRPVDPAVGNASAWKVVDDYDCTLNQTELKTNNNKFYRMQLLESVGSGGSYLLHTRWGRVGEIGQTGSASFGDVDTAAKAFGKKFHDKTRNKWEQREAFAKVAGQYDLVETDLTAPPPPGNDDGNDAGSAQTGATVLPSTLDAATLELVTFLFDKDMFKTAMAGLSVDVTKLPLGALSPAQVQKGYAVLEDIEAELKGRRRSDVLQSLSSKFYTIIPHAFPRSQVPPVIGTEHDLTRKYDLVNTLSDIEKAQSMESDRKSKAAAAEEPVREHPADLLFDQLNVDLALLDADSDEYALLKTYVDRTGYAGRGHELRHIWALSRHHEDSRFAAYDHLENRRLLWHGTNVAVVAAICKCGLRIMPHSGGRVGRGIYLASQHNKSVDYVSPARLGGKSVGIMFLVEAALGNEHHILHDDPSLKAPPKGFDSVVALGRGEPDPALDEVLEIDQREVFVPQGAPIPMTRGNGSSFDKSEYLLYDEAQHRIRYILTFNM